MIFSLLSNPLLLLPVLAAIIMALSFHEFAHAFAAEKLGDSTAKNLGRLTLNPLAHIDPMGFILLVTIGFGWGKPVPYNEYNLKKPKRDSALIALAGPFSNLLLMIVGILAMYALAYTSVAPNSLLPIFLFYLIQFNIILMIFNLIPLPPLDGSKLLFAILPDKYSDWKQKLSLHGPMILLLIIIFDRILPVSLLGSLFSLFTRFLNFVLP